jgi:Peroxiredoxin
MKRIVITLSLASAWLLTACAPKASETTLIQGRIEGGIADQVTAYVLDYNINEPIEIIDGSFNYELATNPAIVATFSCMMDGKRISQPLIPDGSNLSLVFSPEGATLESSNKKSINYRMLEVDQVHQEMADFASQYLSMQRDGASKEQLDSMAELRRPISDRLQALYREDLEKHKDNFLSVQGLVGLQGNLTDEQKDSLIHTLDSTVIQTARIQMILNDIQGRMRSKEGMPFVDFSIDTENGTVRFSDYIGKGKYVLVDFWASWCQPCIMEMPLLKDVYNRFYGSDFTILGVAVSDKPEDSRAAIREHALPWEQILGTGNVAMDAYGINSIPHVILFGPDGTILKRDLRGKQIGDYLNLAIFNQ